MSDPVFDKEAYAIARIQEILTEFEELGQRRRMLDYLMAKMVGFKGLATADWEIIRENQNG